MTRGNSNYKFLKLLLCSLAALLFSGAGTLPSLAHEGHDHGESKPVAAQVGKSAEVRAVRVAGFEIALKHPPLELDKEITGKVFLSRYETNEPVENAKIVLTIERANEKALEVNAVASNGGDSGRGAVGSYTVKLPPMSAGEVQIGAHFDALGRSEAATFGRVSVSAHTPETANENYGSVQNVLFLFGALGALGLIGAFVWLGVRQIKNDSPRTNAAEIGKETVSA